MVVTAPLNNNQGLENEIIAEAVIPNKQFKPQEVSLSEIYESIQDNRIFAQKEDRNQAQILKTYSFKMSGNIKDDVKFEILNTILGGTPSSRHIEKFIRVK